MKDESSITAKKNERVRRTMDVVRDVATRRMNGEALSDAEIMNAHPELLPELKQQLRTLGRVEAGRHDAKTEPTVTTEPHDAHHASAVPSLSIPGYEILAELHRGGQGVVYRAIQASTKREVAIKVMKEGPFAGHTDRARFDREVQILGGLDHPNIVTIHDSGSSAGSSYFVMNYVSGPSLDEYVQQTKPSVEETLRLFVVICRAMNAGHIRGIIHRDLKPNNIRIDPEEQPHILDFGLARDTSEHSAPLMTVTGQFVGSMPWASPEQAEGIPGKIDIRTDVYSLGVILYYLLTDKFPYEVTGNMRDVLDNILYAEPSRPGTICREIDNEVETIILKCLAKEPERRYQSAGALADDIERYLTHQPILARAPSTVYQLKKLIVRHKLPATLVMMLFVLIVGFAIGMSILYSRATFAEQQARNEAGTANAISDFLIQDMLGSSPHRVTQGRLPSVEELLENASARVESSLDKPLIKAAVLSAIGNAYLSFGRNQIAEKHLRGAVEIYEHEYGERHPKTILARIALMHSLFRQNKRTEGMQLAEETLVLANDGLGENHKMTLQAADEIAFAWALGGKIDEAKALYDRTFQRRCRVMSEDDPATLSSIDQWSTVLRAADRTEEAERYARMCLERLQRKFGRENSWTVDAMVRLGELLSDRGRLTEAEEILVEVCETCRNAFGPDDMKTLNAGISLALLFRQQERIDDATVLLRRIETDSRRALGDDHPTRLKAMQYLGSVLWRKQHYAEALTVESELLALRKKLYGDQDARTAVSMTSVSSTLHQLGRYEEAESLLRRALDIQRRSKGDVSWYLRWLAKTLVAQGKMDEARPFAEELLAFRKKMVDHPEADADQLGMYARELLTIRPADMRNPGLGLEVARKALERSSGPNHSVRRLLALAYNDTGNSAKAIEIMKEVLDACPLEHSRAREIFQRDTVRFLEESSQPEAAEEVYRNTLVRRREQYDQNHPDIAQALEDLGAILVRHDKLDDAEPMLRECLTIRESALSPDHWLIGWTNTLLGTLLTRQARFQESEQLLLKGHDQMRDNHNAPIEKRQAALARLVELYEVSDQEDKATKHRKRLQDRTTPQTPPPTPP
ncbi:MAG: tetratricopeptide repeat protein [Phycisphaerales bacterium]|nr:tetratricopeptide repeat protein [Phycisphaerales bacterium]